jgi:hypothetical protein
MTKIRDEIAKSIKEIAQVGRYEIFTGEVTQVNEQNATCHVETAPGIIIENVRIRSVIDELTGVFVIPAKNSIVVIAKLDGGQDYTLLNASKIDKWLLKIGNTSAEAKDGLFVFNNGNNDGLVILSKCLENLNKLKNYVSAVDTAAKGIAIALDALVPGTSIAYTGVTEPASAACVFVNMENPKIKH